MNQQFSLRMLVAAVSTAAIFFAIEANFRVFSKLIENPTHLFFSTCIGIVLTLFWSKHCLLNSLTRYRAAVAFTALLAIFTPVLWLVSPDWGTPHVRPIANYVGLPIAVLAVPTASFFSLLFADEKPTYSIRDVVELMLVPVWFVTWIFIETFVFNWVWI